MKSETYAPGQVIIREGDTGRDLFILTEGRVEVSTRGPQGDYLLNELEAPALFGEISFILEGVPRTATAKAKTPTTVFVLEQREVRDQLTSLPQWLKPVLATLADRIRSQDQKIRDLEKEIIRLTGGPPPPLET
ncbi:MAG: cyclic nucleotide-binding domain-containing protein [Deltaproteobacteria bacterium]|nr:cyclic nucleotide-binding domain-containing protein [Deltaproteobacteria bacterium]MBW1925111.1 cyclic nucleotide-binding domain-containing protein [Deltaproteobacteria bacterium]MBW1950401.1 cyclic nucleotide-binding domain-containing protein [Deltaproteobacteria bacterium]MBW2009257.1 cyclic nucleotide-binding domain-containing protein [Deltaproteobacteria bacterium]MBW2102348.1 cyclic nucleotide-binding domain-containing protein [Deltaproteobacteria bacterium]